MEKACIGMRRNSILCAATLEWKYTTKTVLLSHESLVGPVRRLVVSWFEIT